MCCRDATSVVTSCVMQGYALGLQAQLQVVLDSEPWSICTVPERVQHFVDTLVAPQAPGSESAAAPDADAPSAAPADAAVEGQNHDAAALGAKPLRDAIRTAIGTQTPAESSTPAGARTQVVLPYGRYYIVNSVALLLQHIESLLAFGAVPCALQFDMGGRVSELLRAFNARSQQLVLGAGAMATAGLKSITARHMAVCSQGLLLLEALMPTLRHRVLAGAPPANVGALASLLDSASEVRLEYF
jgi:vacuolar protein sorting-associated protein 54